MTTSNKSSRAKILVSFIVAAILFILGLGLIFAFFPTPPSAELSKTNSLPPSASAFGVAAVEIAVIFAGLISLALALYWVSQ